MRTFDCLGRRWSRRRLSLVTIGLSLGVLWWSGASPAYAGTGRYAPPSLTIDDPSPEAGGPVTLIGTGCEPASTVSFTLEPGTVALGTTTADADGSYRFSRTFPPVTPGSYTILATCGPIRTTTEITISKSSPVPAQLSRTDDAGRPPDGSTPIAFTGVQVVGLVATGASLLALGVVALLYGRRWHRSRV